MIESSLHGRPLLKRKSRTASGKTGCWSAEPSPRRFRRNAATGCCGCRWEVTADEAGMIDALLTTTIASKKGRRLNAHTAGKKIERVVPSDCRSP